MRRHDRTDAGTAVAGARAGDRGADAGQKRDDRCGLRIGELFAQSHQMTAGQVAGLVREHADDFVRRLGVEQCAGIDEDVTPVHDEGVEGAVVEDDDLDVLLGQAGRLQDRRRVVAHQLLDFGVADDRRAARGGALGARLLGRRTAGGAAQRDGGDERKRAPGWRHAPCPDRCPVLDHAEMCHWIA